jgi:hypothetical protein
MASRFATFGGSRRAIRYITRLRLRRIAGGSASIPLATYALFSTYSRCIYNVFKEVFVLSEHLLLAN